MKPVLGVALLLYAVSSFAQTPATTISEPFPTSGSVAGGDVVLFRVANPPYCDIAACPYVVTFDGIPARATEMGPYFLRVVTPAHKSGDAAIELTLVGSGVIAKSVYKYRFAGSNEVGAPDTYNYERVLVPLAVGSDKPVEGAYGSRWTTELWISNSGNDDVEVFNGWPDCGSPTCRGTRFPFIAAHTSKKVMLPSDVSSAGYLFYVQKGGAQDIQFSLRARDVSRSEENAGTELPVMRGTGSVSRLTTLLNVPVESTSRTSLRVYADSLPSAHVRLFGTDDVPVAEADVPLGPADGKPYGETHGFPARSLYAQVSDLHELFPGLPSGRYRVEVTANGGWVSALSTITNNVTQLITAIGSQEVGPFGVVRW